MNTSHYETTEAVTTRLGTFRSRRQESRFSRRTFLTRAGGGFFLEAKAVSHAGGGFFLEAKAVSHAGGTRNESLHNH